ncbi:histidine kinase [Nonlabens sp. MB-3u-79]|uniref:GAF domain-containing sensor histidine kinase n=1 Tax=Nonlabens sp. MB-3u-79 TaxID=2058134 RepID=UPI000C3130C6|nr:GAF domain-containing sensor histidine kinase [Nonlabens sp. MB-3u-79]AUC79728.1 histidine kinase [Nonlabens sp. MB-3u-79]
MAKVSLHPREVERLAYLESFHIDAKREKVLDELTELACKLTNVPKSLISIVHKDEVWFKSQSGLQLDNSPREFSFCAHATANDNDFFYVEDVYKTRELQDHPYLKNDDNIRFYAGVQLKDEHNLPLGTVCVLDDKPHTLNTEQKKSLEMIADLIMRQLMLNKTNIELQEKSRLLEENNEMLKNFARVVSHDMKMPLASMILTTDLLSEKYSGRLDTDGKRYLHSIKDTAFSMSDYIDNILSYYESDLLAIDDKEEFDINSIIEKVEEMVGLRDDIQLMFPEDNLIINSNSAAIEQVLLNLIGNSIKYNDQETIVIQVTAAVTPKYYKISVKDNGIGIPKDKQEDIFKLFTTLNQTDRSGKKGNGIGLSTVKILVDKLGGTIKCDSKINSGTTFTFTVKK